MSVLSGKCMGSIVRIFAAILICMMGISLITPVNASEEVPSEASIKNESYAYIYGLNSYLIRDRISRNLNKKSVAYVTQILDGANRVVNDEDVVKGYYYRYALVEGVNTFNVAAVESYSYLGGVTYDYFSEAEPYSILKETSADGRQTDYYVLSAADLMEADIIVTVGCISMDAMIDSFGGREYRGILICDVPAGFEQEEADDQKALTSGYYLGCAHGEMVNPVDLCAYYYDRIIGIDNGEQLEEKVNAVFADTRFYRGYPNKLGENYDANAIANMIEWGTEFYLDNHSVFEGGAFDANGMSAWEPESEEETTELISEEATAEEKTATETTTEETTTETAAEETITEEVTTEETAESVPAGIPYWTGVVVAAAAAIVLFVVIFSRKKKNE